MQRIQIGVVRSRPYGSTDGFVVYGDGGSGSMDWDHPVTPRRVLFRPDDPATTGHLLGGHLMADHLDGTRPDGHLEGTHLLDRCLMPAALVFFETEPFVFGRFRHGVVTQDAAWHATTGGVALQETVVNSGPEPAEDFRPVAQDGGTGVVTFSFTASERLVG